MYKVLLFDVDGTMLDSEGVVVEGLMRVSQVFTGTRVDYATAKRAFSMPSVRSLIEVGIPPEELGRAIKIFDAYCFGEAIAEPFPGIVGLLTILRDAGVSLGVYSARKEYEFDMDPGFQPLLPFFHLKIGTSYAASKPAPDGLLRLMTEQNLMPSEILFVGDSVIDSKAAEAAGVDLALAGWNPGSDRINTKWRYCPKTPAEILEIPGVL